MHTLWKNTRRGVDMSIARPRPDLAVYDRAMRVDLPQAVAEASRLLGPKLIAYICGVTDTRSVRAWAKGDYAPRDAAAQRVRTALWVASLIADHDSAHVAQAWFQGLNPQLDDRSPARLLREGDLAEVGPEVIAAARAFVVGG